MSRKAFAVVRHNRWLAFACLAVALPVARAADPTLSPAAAQAAAGLADQPQLRVGARWSYVETRDHVERTWSREIIGIDAVARHMTVQDERGRTHAFDVWWNPIGAARERLPRYRFPLSIGKEWSSNRDVAGGFLRVYEKVTGVESITVPAGALECWRIEGTHSFVNKALSRISEWKRWYCPAVNALGRWQLDVRQWNAYAPPTHSQSSSELVSYRPAPDQ